MSDSNSNDRRDFLNISTDELKQIYKDSQSLTTLYIVWIVFLVLIACPLIIGWIIVPNDEKYVVKVISLFFIPFFLLYVPAIIGTYKRAKWVCTLGFVISVFMIPAFPIGTILGTAGARAFQRKYLFGPDRISHSDIKKEYQYRKAHRIS